MSLLLVICFSILTMSSLNVVEAQKGGGGGGGSASGQHNPQWQITSYAYIVAEPNTIGVGQKVSIFMWVDLPLPGATLTNDVRRHDYTLTITKPNNTTETKHWDVISDSTGVQFTTYIPDQIGTYTLKFDYPPQKYTWSGTYANDTFLGDSATTTITVQETLLPNPIGSYPLPTEYWTRPIEGQNTYWYTISSNDLGNAYIGNEPYGRYYKDGTAPNSAHIMWTKPIRMGGVVGGTNVGPNGEMFFTGSNYDVITENPIIMYGMLYYQLPIGGSPSGGGYICVDLRTGATLWVKGIPEQTFGQILSYSDGNGHGAMGGFLWYSQGTNMNATDALTGTKLFNLTNVPSGTMLYGPNGEILKYQLDSTKKWLALWNTTVALGRMTQTSGEINASNSFSWNKTIPNLPAGSWSIENVFYDDLILCSQGNFGTRGNWEGANMTAISINPLSLGNILWTKHYPAPEGNATRQLGTVDPISRVIVFRDKETLNLWGYSLDNGNKLWGPVTISDSGWDYFHASQYTYSSYGNLYISGMTGVIQCFDIKTGDLKWSYGNGGPGNSTNGGLQTPFGNYPTNIGAIADGKLYTFVFEHTADSPIQKEYTVRCINATTGEELWMIDSFVTAGGGGQRGNLLPSLAIADGYLAYLNGYDMQFYCIGRGPSATTIEAPKSAVKLGDSLVISGSVTDISAGTTQNEQAARFPNGVPAVSDASQSAWMEYVYMQKPRPIDTEGVQVTISVVDANGNYREIGTATSNMDGFYSLSWKPDIEGKYTVYASFGGSNSYYPSHAVTAFIVDPSPATPTPTQIPIQSMTDQYFAPAVVGIIAAIAIVGSVLAVLLIRKRP